TIPEVLQQAGIDWRIYQDPNDNWTGALHGCLAFDSFRKASPGNSFIKEECRAVLSQILPLTSERACFPRSHGCCLLPPGRNTLLPQRRYKARNSLQVSSALLRPTRMSGARQLSS